MPLSRRSGVSNSALFSGRDATENFPGHIRGVYFFPEVGSKKIYLPECTWNQRQHAQKTHHGNINELSNVTNNEKKK